MSTTAGQRSRPQRPTIISVAEHAGVSKSLASRALRGEVGVSQEKRDRVMRSAKALGYRLTSAARSLVAHDSGFWGWCSMILAMLTTPRSLTGLKRPHAKK